MLSFLLNIFFFPIRITLYKIQICGNSIVLKKTDIDSDTNCFGIAHLSRSGWKDNACIFPETENSFFMRNNFLSKQCRWRSRPKNVSKWRLGIGNGIGSGSNVFIDSNFRGKRYRQPTTDNRQPTTDNRKENGRFKLRKKLLLFTNICL